METLTAGVIEMEHSWETCPMVSNLVHWVLETTSMVMMVAYSSEMGFPEVLLIQEDPEMLLERTED